MAMARQTLLALDDKADGAFSGCVQRDGTINRVKAFGWAKMEAEKICCIWQATMRAVKRKGASTSVSIQKLKHIVESRCEHPGIGESKFASDVGSNGIEANGRTFKLY